MRHGLHVKKSRVETLVDGIFAIAMTILILEVKVPELTDRASVGELMHALAHHGYVIGAYFFSFGMLGVFWFWHQRIVETLADIDGRAYVYIMAFLSLICAFPFVTALLGRYPTNLGALLTYVPLLGLIILVQTLFFLSCAHRGLVAPGIAHEQVEAMHRRNLRGCGVFALAAVPTALRVEAFSALGCALLGLALILYARKATLRPGKAQ